MGSKFGPSYMAVCEITFKTWADTLSGHGKVCMDMIGHQLKFIINQQFSSNYCFQFVKISFRHIF